MSTTKKIRKRRKGENEDAVDLSKEENSVAKHLRFNMETKQASLFGDQTDYFIGSKAVNFLLESKWAGGIESSVQFTDRESVAVFMQKLLNNGLFSRVHLIKTEKKVKDDKKKKIENEKNENVSKEKRDVKEPRKIKKKVKTTLEVHNTQLFFDDDQEAYSWIYDPTSPKTFIFGVLLVLLIIAICLFPLWPESIREYSWYVSVAGVFFVGSILLLAVLRYIVYGIVWILSIGKLDFWMLPNLTEECGFFESFVPAYEYSWKISKDIEGKHGDATEKAEKIPFQAELTMGDTHIGNSPSLVDGDYDLDDRSDFKEDNISDSSGDKDYVKVTSDDAIGVVC